MEEPREAKGNTGEAELFSHDAALLRQLAQEEAHPLTLLRELVSNAASREVQATEIGILCFQHPDYGWAFRIQDDGIGMDYTGSTEFPGKLDRFLALGLSALPGLPSDEFGYKGLGTKLAFQSKYIEIETWPGMGNIAKIIIGGPWEYLQRSPRPEKPKPLFFEVQPALNQKRGTKITVYGHLPLTGHELTFEEVRQYLLHRSFLGFTRERARPPRISLTLGNRTEWLAFGHPVLQHLKDGRPPAGTVFVAGLQRTEPVAGKDQALSVILHGVYTNDPGRFGISGAAGSAGIMLSVEGIPYCRLELDQYAGEGQGLRLAPGADNVCLVAECDDLRSAMNLSRSGIEAGPEREAFERCLRALLQDIEGSDEWKRFSSAGALDAAAAGVSVPAPKLDESRRKLMAAHQEWVFMDGTRVYRKPENAYDTLVLVWKLEGMRKLPFFMFESLGHGAGEGDVIAHLQETATGVKERYVTLESEAVLTHVSDPELAASFIRTIVCWDIGRDRDIELRETNLPFKFIAQWGKTFVRVYALSRIPGISVAYVKESEF